MDMFYLIINKKNNFFSQKVGPGGGLPYIYIIFGVFMFLINTIAAIIIPNAQCLSCPGGSACCCCRII